MVLISLTLLAGTVTRFSAGWMWHDQQRIAQIASLIITALAVTTIWRGALLTQLTRLPISSRLALGAAFAIGGVSTGFSAYPRFGSLEWSTVMLLLGLVLVLADQARTTVVDFDNLARRTVVTLAFLISLKIMIIFIAALVKGVQFNSHDLFQGTFSNRRGFGQVASLIIPLLAYPLLSGTLSRTWRWGIFALLAVWWMLVIVSGTRGTWMALALAAALLGIVAWRTCVSWIRVQAITLGIGIVLFGIVFVWLPSRLGIDVTLENRLTDISALNGRAELWTAAWEQIKAHPLLGIGPMHFAAIRHKFGAHPHNALLQLVAEWGVPAALALAYPLASGMLRLLARLRQQCNSPDFLLVSLTASLLAAGVQSMVDGVIVMPYTQIWLVLVVGWTLGVYFRGTISAPAYVETRIMRLGVFAIALLAVAAILNGIFPEVLNRSEITRAHIVDGTVWVPPRYWSVGWIP